MTVLRFYKHIAAIRSFLIIFTSLCISQYAKAQSDIVTEFTDGVNNIVGSFMDNPYHHENTLKIKDLCDQNSKLTDEMLDQAPYNSVDYDYLSNAKGMLKCLDQFTGSIAGYIRGGIDSGLFEYYFNPALNAFGWTWKVVKSTPDIILYEYSKENFKIMLAKNIRPKKDGGDYNEVSYSCYAWQKVYKENYVFCGRVIFGGDYQVVQFKDDSTTNYYTVTKLASYRGG